MQHLVGPRVPLPEVDQRRGQLPGRSGPGRQAGPVRRQPRPGRPAAPNGVPGPQHAVDRLQPDDRHADLPLPELHQRRRLGRRHLGPAVPRRRPALDRRPLPEHPGRWRPGRQRPVLPLGRLQPRRQPVRHLVRPPPRPGQPQHRHLAGDLDQRRPQLAASVGSAPGRGTRTWGSSPPGRSSATTTASPPPTGPSTRSGPTAATTPSNKPASARPTSSPTSSSASQQRERATRSTGRPLRSRIARGRRPPGSRPGRPRPATGVRRCRPAG